MSDHVIEPTEIIVEGARATPNENAVHINPWIRCIARFLDYSLFFLSLLLLRKLFSGKLPFGDYERLIPFEYFVWIPIEALLLSTWGTTPGKFFMRTKLKAGKKERLDFVMALRRSFAVWVRGLGMGLPVLNFICPLLAYNKLKLFKMTSWDRDDHIQVTHHPIGRWRIYLAVFVAVVGILYYYKEKNLELTDASRLVRPLHEYSAPQIVAAGPLFSAENSSYSWCDRK